MSWMLAAAFSLVALKELMCFGQYDQPLAKKQDFEMATLYAGIAFNDRIDAVVTLSKIAADGRFTTAEPEHERGTDWHRCRNRGALELESGAGLCVQVRHGGSPWYVVH
jgi:hypothetical protein